MSASTQAPTRDAALAHLLRHGEATAAEMADNLQVSVQIMRRHLRSLEDEGLVEACTTGDGPGRPSNRWHLTAEGHSQPQAVPEYVTLPGHTTLERSREIAM